MEQKEKKMPSLNIIIVVALVAIFAGAGFFAGTKFQQRTFTRMIGQRFQGQGQGQARNGQRTGFRPVTGEIISNDGTSITVKLDDGSSKIVMLSDKTAINKASAATKEDLVTGEKVMVIGQENSDGSVTAQDIQLNPINRVISAPTN